MRRLSLLLLVAVATLGACGRSGEQARGSAAGEDGWRGTLLAEPWPKPDFTLTATDGRPYDFAAETDGYLTLLFFGYTHCPDVCPLHMANLDAVLDQLPGDVRANTKVVFATTDPARDTPARLKDWLGAFDPSFIGLTGSLPEVVAAQEAAGVAVAGAEPPDDDGSYVVGHAAQVIAYTRDREAHIVYPFGTRQGDWADDLPRLLEEPAWNP
jgi:protein SCO1/2